MNNLVKLTCLGLSWLPWLEGILSLQHTILTLQCSTGWVFTVFSKTGIDYKFNIVIFPPSIHSWNCFTKNQNQNKNCNKPQILRHENRCFFSTYLRKYLSLLSKLKNKVQIDRVSEHLSFGKHLGIICVNHMRI